MLRRRAKRAWNARPERLRLAFEAHGQRCESRFPSMGFRRYSRGTVQRRTCRTPRRFPTRRMVGRVASQCVSVLIPRSPYLLFSIQQPLCIFQAPLAGALRFCCSVLSANDRPEHFECLECACESDDSLGDVIAYMCRCHAVKASPAGCMSSACNILCTALTSRQCSC